MFIGIDLVGSKLMVVTAVDANYSCVCGKQLPALGDAGIVNPGIKCTIDQGCGQIKVGKIGIVRRIGSPDRQAINAIMMPTTKAPNRSSLSCV